MTVGFNSRALSKRILIERSDVYHQLTQSAGPHG
jgi:hypothetical protein